MMKPVPVDAPSRRALVRTILVRYFKELFSMHLLCRIRYFYKHKDAVWMWHVLCIMETGTNQTGRRGAAAPTFILEKKRK
jgi:hypothetical protein